MVQLSYPGVYVEELSSGVHTITGVATSIAAFIGWAPQGPTDEAVLIESWSDFQRQFGGFTNFNGTPNYLGYSVNQFFGNGGSQAYIVRLAGADATTASATIGGMLRLYASSPGAWGNNLQVRVTPQSGNPSRYALSVIDGARGSVLESFVNLSNVPGDPQYVVSVIDNSSQYVTFEAPVTGAIAQPGIPAPTQNAAATAAAGGSLNAGTYYYVVSALYGNLESLPSNEVSIVTTGTTSENTITWAAAGSFNNQSPTGYKIYRGGASGGENVYYTVGAVLTFTDTGAAATNGSPTPSAAATQIPAPQQAAATSAPIGGTLVNPQEYFYVVSALYGNLESMPSNEENVVAAGAASSNTVSWTAAPTFNNQSPTGYKIYRGTAAGAENVFFIALASATSFVDTGAAGTSGGPTPSNVGLSLSGGQDGTVLQPNASAFEKALLNDPNGYGLHVLDRVPIFNLLCVPGETTATTIQALQQYCYNHRAFYIVDSPGNLSITSLIASGPVGGTSGSLTQEPYCSYSAYYYPWIQAPDPLANNRPAYFPPCGFIAGIYAATDANRGVWKAPAGIDASLSGVSGLQWTLTDLENGDLNQQAVNCLRQFRVYGDVVWGARTLDGNDQAGSQWKYIPIRRLALYIESSLIDGTQWVVFEPNDEPLWSQIRLNVGVFMNGLFRQGAFQGATPSQAYFVKCDAENNPQSSIDQGIVNILVGFAPLYPAEFVVIQIQQIAGQLQS
jgi:hypothetical protein